MEDRLIAVIVSEQVMVSVFSGRVCLLLDMPKDAQIVRVCHNPQRRSFLVIVQSAAFEPVQEGFMIPERMVAMRVVEG